MRCVDSTDDQLWQAIADNTKAMSELVAQQFEMDEKIGAADPSDRTKLIRSHLELINRFQREYRDYISELRRRHKIAEPRGNRIAEESAKRILTHTSVDEIFAPAH
jgi:hypothetical protein